MRRRLREQSFLVLRAEHNPGPQVEQCAGFRDMRSEIELEHLRAKLCFGY